MISKQKKKHDCGCSGHPSGRPKLSRGPCYGYGVRPAVRERIHGKRIERVWLEAIDLAGARSGSSRSGWETSKTSAPKKTEAATSTVTAPELLLRLVDELKN